MTTPGKGPPPPKPRLKINFSRTSSVIGDGSATPGTVNLADGLATPASATPASATPSEGARKLKLRVPSSSEPATPADQPPIKTKAGRQPKPTQKLVESKKRPHEDDDDVVPLSSSGPPTATKIKFRASLKGQRPPKTPTQLVVKPRGRPPVHPPGDGYDSEASDREVDPAIEEQFILRMPPGEHCDYVRQCMENGKIGVHRSLGGADVHFKFFEEDTRRAVVTVKGQSFAAVMVDLPTITEAMKTWDKKMFMKSADICQMLLVFQKVKNESEARHAPLPSMIDSNFKWPHGLTPPMHDCINRRFARTISRKEIEDKEAEVERLLGEDANAVATKWEWVDERGDGDAEDEDEEMADEDAEGEIDDTDGYFGPQDPAAHGDDDLEADLEAAFADDFMVDTPAEAPTPAVDAIQASVEADESEEDESDDDDDDDDLDEDERAQRDEEQGVRDIINDLKKSLKQKIEDRKKTQNRILIARIDDQIRQLKSEIELKMSSIGLEMDDEE